MVYLKGLFRRISLVLVIWTICLEQSCFRTEANKIAYKKPIYGRTNTIKEKRYYRSKADVIKPPTTTTTEPSPPTAIPVISPVPTSTTPITPEVTMPKIPISASIAPTPELADETTTTLRSNAISDEITAEQQHVAVVVAPHEGNATEAKEETTVSPTPVEGGQSTVGQTSIWDEMEEEEKVNEELTGNSIAVQPEQQLDTDAKNDGLKEAKGDEPVQIPSTMLDLPTIPTPVTTESSADENKVVPCTCAVFLSSQFKRGSSEPPKEKPVIVDELNKNFPCNAVGQKQCQTKCLEAIVPHLPNSANILCATLNRDCRKERAYLFIKNCRNQWFNTNLAAGREYCCKGGQPYSCPMV